MYFTTYGISALLHLLVSHPRVVAAFGLASTVVMLATPFGPRSIAGAESYALSLERHIADGGLVNAGQLAQAERRVQAFLATPREALRPVVREVLSTCGPQCTGLSVNQVMEQPQLLKQVLMLSALDEVWQSGTAAEGRNGSH